LYALLLKCEEHRRLADIETERHSGDALANEDVLDLLRRLLEQAHFRADRAAHPWISRPHMVFAQPRAVELVMPRRRAEIPDPGLAGAGQQRVADQLVARPFADHRARDVADIVLIEAEHRAEPRGGERLARARQAVAMQSLEIDALLEIDLRRSGGLQRPRPAMR